MKKKAQKNIFNDWNTDVAITLVFCCSYIKNNKMVCYATVKTGNMFSRAFDSLRLGIRL